MNKKEIIEEVVVSDRTSPMTNPRTNESLGALRPVAKMALKGDGLVSWLFQKDEGVIPLRRKWSWFA